MPVPADQKFSGFADGGNLAVNDIVVGLRNGVNTRFNFDGFPGVYLPLAGGTMAGTINMDTNSITGLPIPTNPTDAASKAYVDSVTAPVGLVGTIQRSTGTDWVASTSTFADTYAINTLLFAGSANAVSGLPTAASGLLVTSAGGVPSIGTDIPTAVTIGGAYIYRVGGTDVAVADGGTGVGTFTAYSVICAGTTATGAFQNVVGVGTLNQVLVSQGAGALPQWASVPGLVPAALTRTDDTNVTLTLGGTPSTALLQATSLTLGWTGQLSLTRGGSNASLTASNGGVVYSTATAMAILAGTATANLPLLSGSTAAPSWGAYALSLGGALTTAGALTTVGAFDATFTFTGVTGVTFPTSGTLATTSQIPTGAALTRVDDTNVTMTLGGSPTTALINATSLTLGWTGQLSVPRGGSGNSTFTAYSVLCAGTTDTGAFQNVSGLGTSGQVLQSNGAGTLPTWATIPGATSAALTRVDDTNVTLTLGGAPSTALLTATSLTLGWSGQLSLTRGGSNASLTASNGGIVYSTATAMAILAGTATAGQILRSGSSAAPSWSTATYPATAGTSGNILKSDGTNWSSAAPSTLYSPPQVTYYTTGSGTYNVPAGALYITIEMVGGGAGGMGNSNDGSIISAPVAGGNSTFDGSTYVATGGAIGVSTNYAQALGGVPTGGDINVTGGDSQGGQQNAAIGSQFNGGNGGSSYFGAGGGGALNGSALNAKPYGAGGGGAGTTTNASYVTGAGGGAGGYLRKNITSLAASYTYAVGSGGAGGNGSNYNGGNGQAGVIIVTAYFQ